MSNLLKSKFFLGVMMFAVMFVGVVALDATSASADCSITSTLRVGSKGDQVKCLQTALGLSADGSFGPKTKAGVVAWQASVGLVADGVFGPKSIKAWTTASMSATYPAGCTGATGYSSTTGLACYAIPSNLPAGCTSTIGFSSSTGMSCAGTVTTYPAGCTSASGFSPTTGASCATGAVNNQTGPVSASLASNNPASGYIIANQATADLAHFTFSGTGTINTVVLQRTGVSDQNTLANVYLYDGMTRLTDGYSFNNAGQLTMNGLGIAVSGSRTISVKADVANVTNASSLGITLIGFTAAGNTAQTVSIRGNEMTYGVGNLATAYLGVNTVTGTPTVNAGTSAYTVWSAPVQVNVRAVWLKGANFRMTGSAPADALGNIRLYVDGVQVGTAATLGTITGSNYAMFDFSAVPISLSTGSHTIDVRADIVKGASYTVTVSLQQAADLVIYDGQVGVNIAALGPAGVAFTSNNAAQITINAGSASVTVDPAFQTMTNVTGGATNALIGKFKVHGYGEDVKVTTLTVTPVLTGMTPTATGLNNVTIYFCTLVNTCSQVGSSQTWTSGNLPFNLGSQMIIPAGTDSYIEVRADLQTTGSVNYTAGTVRADLVVGSGNAQGQTSHTTISPGFPGSGVTGTTLSVQTGVLAVSKSSFANTSSNPNTDDVKIGEFTLQNQSSSESVRVRTLAVSLFNGAGTALTSSTTPALNNFSNLRTTETSGSGATPIQPSATNTFSVDFTLTPGGTKTIGVLASVGAQAASATVVTRLTVTSLGSSSNVSVSQNGNGTAVTGQTITLISGTVSTTPTLVSSASTSGQFIPAANGSATGVTVAEFNIGATNGSATISEAKFVVRGNATVSGAGTVASISVGQAGGTQSLPAFITTAVTNATTLNDAGGISASDTTLIVTSSTGIAAGSVLTIESEDILVVSDAGGNTVTTVTRGYNGTTAAIHADTTAVSVKNGIAYLTNLSLPVPNGGSGLNLDAKITYSAVGTNGITSMSVSNISLAYLKYTAGNTTSTACVTSLACTFNMAEVAAPTMAMVGSKPTLAVVDSSDQLSNSLVKVAEITVTADAKGDIKLVTLPVKISTTPSTSAPSWDGAANAVILKDTSDAVITSTSAGVGGVSGSCTGAEGAKTGVCTAVVTLDGTGYLITAGTSKTFRVYVTVAGVAGAVNTMSLSTTLGASSSLSWLDVAGANTTPITGANNTTYFYNYPTTTSVITN